MDDETAARQIVRVYSFHAEERLPLQSDAHALARVLSVSEPSIDDIKKPWRRFFEPWEPDENAITKVLSTEAAKLQEQWIRFQKFVDKDERIDFTNSEPTMEGVIRTVATVSRAWQTKREKGKRGKATALFHRLCSTLDAHSSMLEIVPKGNQYVSIFAGTMTSIVKASVNHENIAEELAEALCIISEHVADCETEFRLFRTEAMMCALSDLYAHVFLFLNDTLDWYLNKRRRRLLDSFNEKFLDHFELEIDNIKRKSEMIKRKAVQSMAAEQRVTRLIVDDTANNLRIGLEGIRRERAENNFAAQQRSLQFQKERAAWQEKEKHLASLHAELVSLLTEVVQNQKRLEDHDLVLNPGTTGLQSAISGLLMYDMAPLTRERILLGSAHLEDFFHRDRVRISTDYFGPVRFHAEAVNRLASWIHPNSTKSLCLAAPEGEYDERENPATKLAATFIEIAAGSKVPLISYFCELRRGQMSTCENTNEEQGLVELVYALIRQTIELLPLQFEGTTLNLSAERFQSLDGKAASLMDAISLLEDVQTLLPGEVLCVIDGLQWLDDRSTSACLAEFLGKLRDTDSHVKVLFTTTGHSRALLDCLSSEEWCIFAASREGFCILDDIVDLEHSS